MQPHCGKVEDGSWFSASEEGVRRFGSAEIDYSEQEEEGVEAAADLAAMQGSGAAYDFAEPDLPDRQVSQNSLTESVQNHIVMDNSEDLQKTSGPLDFDKAADLAEPVHEGQVPTGQVWTQGFVKSDMDEKLGYFVHYGLADIQGPGVA